MAKTKSSDRSAKSGDAVSFECRRCGRCCSEIRNLALFEWEAERLAKRKAKIKPAIIAKVGNIRMILQWGLESRKGKCPFLTKKGCRIYKDRPLVCRAFPFNNSGSWQTSGILSEVCSSLVIPRTMSKTKEALLVELEQLYGDTYIAAQKLDAARVWISDLSRYAVRRLGPKISEFSGRELGLLELCIDSGIYDRKFLRREIGFFRH